MLYHQVWWSLLLSNYIFSVFFFHLFWSRVFVLYLRFDRWQLVWVEFSDAEHIGGGYFHALDIHLCLRSLLFCAQRWHIVFFCRLFLYRFWSRLKYLHLLIFFRLIIILNENRYILLWGSKWSSDRTDVQHHVDHVFICFEDWAGLVWAEEILIDWAYCLSYSR